MYKRRRKEELMLSWREGENDVERERGFGFSLRQLSLTLKGKKTRFLQNESIYLNLKYLFLK